MGKAARAKREARVKQQQVSGGAAPNDPAAPRWRLSVSVQARLDLVQFFDHPQLERPKDYVARQTRRNVRAALGVAPGQYRWSPAVDKKGKPLTNGKGDPLVQLELGRTVDGGERFEPIKKTGRRLAQLNAARVDYLIGLFNSFKEGLPADLPVDRLFEIEQDLHALKEGTYTAPDCPMMGEQESFRGPKDRDDDEDDTPDAA